MTAPLRDTLGAVRTDRDVVEVAGPDAASYLQGQCSQDVEALAEGASAWTFVLQPDGKVAVWGRVTRVAPDRFVLDVDPGAGPALITRLERFKLRVDAAVTPLDWTVLAVRGPGATEIDTGDALAVDPEWPGVEGIDLLGPAPRAPAGVPTGDAADLEALRIEAGVPAMGHELTEQTIPAEAGVVERSVSFTKGCYTGQELTARIDSRGGNVPRHLRGIVVDGVEPPAPGSEVVVDGEVVGTVTTAARSAHLQAAVALAYVKRSIDPPAAAVVRGEVGERAGEVRALPLVGVPG
ncbi:MAG: folate-binding protein YgfZ [Acidimicrobiales bacterium]|nr:folate-binding protein YgfZ [Acidimicrobiales bacterium]